jgi:hypothetical protein
MKEVFKKFMMATIEAMGESTVIQGLITLGVVGAWLALVLQNLPVDETLKYAVGIVTGYYFGAKNAQQLRALSRRMQAQERDK